MKESEKDVNIKTEVTLPGNEARGSFPNSFGEKEKNLDLFLLLKGYLTHALRGPPFCLFIVYSHRTKQ